MVTATENRILILVTVVFERTIDVNANVIALLRGKFGHYARKALDHQRGNLLIEVLRQHVNYWCTQGPDWKKERHHSSYHNMS